MPEYDSQINSVPTDAPNPLRCPECKSLDILYGVDATVYYRQSRMKEEDTASEQPVYYNTFDTVEEAECTECGYTENESHGISSKWWEI